MHVAVVSSSQARPEQGGDIGKAEEPALRPGHWLFKESGCSPATPCAGQQRCLLFEVGVPFRVPTSEVTPGSAGNVLIKGVQSPVAQHRQTLEELLICF